MTPVFRLKIKNIINELRLTRVFLLVSLFLLMSGKGWGQTATISGDVTVCQSAATPNITFTGADGAAPYTFIYTINGGTNQTVTTDNGNSIVTVPVPTSVAGIFKYDLVSVTDADNKTATVTGSATVTVNLLPAAITGTTSVCVGSTATLSSATAEGTWSSGTPSVATVNATSGVVTGVSSGTTVITYTLVTGCSVTTTVTVNPLPNTSLIYHF